MFLGLGVNMFCDACICGENVLVVVDVLYLVSGVVVLICTYFGQRVEDSIVNLRRVGGLSYSSLSVCPCVCPCVRVSVCLCSVWLTW